MRHQQVFDRIASKLEVPAEDFQIRNRITGSSDAQIYDIKYNNERAILKYKTTKNEWFFYAKMFSNFNLPAPQPLTVSSSNDIPWVFLEKVPLGLHPKKWTKDEIVHAVQKLAHLHSQFYDPEVQKKLDYIENPLEDNWNVLRETYATNLEKAAKIAKNYASTTPITEDEFLEARNELLTEDYLSKLLTAGKTLLHGDAWVYNFLQKEERFFIIDWQNMFIGPPAWEVLYFYNLMSILIDNIRIKLKDYDTSLDEIIKIYLKTMKENKIGIKKEDFITSLRASVSYHLARFWAPRFKPSALYLEGGIYYVKRILRLLPSRDEFREYMQKTLEVKNLDFE